MPQTVSDPATLLHNSLANGRVHSAYLISGAGDAPRQSALAFARGLACSAAPATGAEPAAKPCEACPACARSREPSEPVEIDGTGKRGPLFRHIGEHPDLFFVDRGVEGTRVRIGQVRALQHALRLAANEGGWRVAVIADAEWLNQEAQNALLKLLEEPPDRTCVVLVASSVASLLPTIRSRSARVVFPAEARIPLRDDASPEQIRALAQRLDGITRLGLPELLDWAEEYRGNRATVAPQVLELLAVGSEWLRERISHAVSAHEHVVGPELDAFRTLGGCRRDLVQRNANPQMVAERGLFAIREALAR